MIAMTIIKPVDQKSSLVDRGAIATAAASIIRAAVR